MTEHVVCQVEDLPPGSSRMAMIGPTEVGVFNIDGELVAVRNRCPHAGAPLCRGALTGTTVSDGPHRRRWAHEGEILKCPWHGWEFKLPEGRSVAEPVFRLSTYPTRVRDGNVVVDDKRRPTETGA